MMEKDYCTHALCAAASAAFIYLLYVVAHTVNSELELNRQYLLLEL